MDLSIIVPAFNEEDYIASCCSSISMALNGKGLIYEVIIINNGSTDNTATVASSFSQVRVINISRTSVAQARNIGVEYAKGEVLAFIDADVVLEGDWGSRISILCKSKVAPFVTGFQYGIREDSSWIERCWFDNMKSTHINGGNLIASRDAFDKLCGFNPKLKTGEDVDFCNRAKIDPEIKYQPDSKLKSIHLGYPTDIRSFMNRECWHGEGDFMSLNAFLNSRIALMAIAYGLAHLILLGFLVSGKYIVFLVLIFLFLGLNLIISEMRFRGARKNLILQNSILNYVYFIARFISLFRAIKGRAKNY
ncbi:glycosyltransferase [Marinobacter subterrani]|uniref:Glycosyltransferase involved in cell wall bisynthesis n=1 Tax=Marinobacter subterrani TaxID=1658765 RepID=A0A0J7J8X2_9GAMM|nr:glycosyltransferase [Marinobacter subterrani]KMQ74617.1 Glycosyltransferase involved in cell wall bisynthesis [Marinobacter subterrani]